jgi:zinc protease
MAWSSGLAAGATTCLPPTDGTHGDGSRRIPAAATQHPETILTAHHKTASRRAALIPLFIVVALVTLVGSARYMTAKEIAPMETLATQPLKPAAITGNGERYADRIQTVKSPKGIEAWLIEEHSVPLIALQFAFDGGAAQDPLDKLGLADFLSTMLDEGAGDIRSREFQSHLDEMAIKLDFDATHDAFTGSFQTLSRNRDRSAELLRLALNEPRFDADAIERMRAALTSALKMDEKDPDKIASRAWFEAAYGDHPYGRSEKGTLEGLKAVTRDDLVAYRRNVFARDGLTIAVVGDITADELSQLLDKVFGDLPEHGKLQPVPEVTALKAATRTVVPMDNPQSVVQFGNQGLKREDPDFIPAYILNYILGGGGFSSRLMDEVREKRGLAYSVYSYLYPFDHGGVFLGGVATKNEAVDQSIEVVTKELRRIAAEGPSAGELDDAKRYLTGSYPLRFDSSAKIASQLLLIQMDDLGIDYIDKRNHLVESVTLDQIKAVAKRLIRPDELIITIVGKPRENKG